MADNLVAPSQNSFIDTLHEFFGTSDEGIAGGIGRVYSTFIGARTAAQIQQNQAAGINPQATASQLNAINAQRDKTINYVTYAGIAVAVLGTLALIYKTIK